MTSPQSVPEVLQISDDEAVALAIFAERPWNSALPTVDDSSVADLQGAAARGVRSLALRGLLLDGGPVTDIRTLITQQLCGALALRVFVSKAHGTPSPLGAISSFFLGKSGDYTLDVATPDGIHSIVAMKGPDVTSLLLQTLTETFEAGIQDPFGDSLVLCVVGTSAFTVKLGEIKEYESGPSGFREQGVTADLASAIARLLSPALDGALSS